MSKRLAQTLVNAGTLGAADVEEALQRQVVFGGSLDSTLLEAELVDEPTMLQAIGAAHDLPAAGKSEIDGIGEHIPRLFPLVFAETYHLVPYTLEGSNLSVLVDGSPDSALLEKIHDRVKLDVKPIATTEVRLHYAMHRLYGTRLLPRFEGLITKLDGGLPDPITVPDDPSHVLSWGVSSAGGASAVQPTRQGRRGGLRSLVATIDASTDRDGIVNTVLRAASSLFDYAGLFLVQGENINGWRGTNTEATERLAKISMPISVPSVFQTIYATQGHYLGPLPKNNGNGELLAGLGRPPPRAACVVPMMVGDKLAVLLYSDNGDQPIAPKRSAAMLVLAQRAGLSLERLILRRKRAAVALLERSDEEQPSPDPHGEAAVDEISIDVAEEHEPQAMPEVEDHEFEVLDEEVGAAMPAPGVPGAVAASQAAVEIGGDGDDSWDTVSFDNVDMSAEASTDAYGRGIHAVADAIDIGDDVVFEDDGEALDEWEDVLADTSDVTVETQPEARVVAPPTVTWDDVISEAAAAARLVPTRKVSTVEVAGTVMDERELLFDGLEATDAQTRRDAIAKLLELGSTIDETLSERFPGLIKFDPLDPTSRVPPFAQCSGMTELLAARGVTAASVVLPHLEKGDPVKRFFAIYYLMAVPYPQGLEVLARRLYDTEPRNRQLAAEALRVYSREPGYQRILEGLRGQLKVPVLESQVSAIQVLGQLRDPAAVPALIPLVVAPDQALATSASSALAVITAQEFGGDVTKWSEWWQTRYNRPRPVWLLDGLHHPNEAIRRIANQELQILTGRTTNFQANASESERNKSIRLWDAWWQQESARYTQPAG